MKITNEEWNTVDEYINLLAKSKNPVALKMLLDLGFEADLFNNEELDQFDLNDALNAVLLGIIEVALTEDRFETIINCNRAHTKQHQLLKKLIDTEYEEEDKEEMYWCLEFSQQYFEQTQKLQSKEYSNKIK